MNEQLELSDKLVDVVDRASRKILVTMLRYSVEKRKSSWDHFRLSARKEQDENLPQFVYAKFKLEEFIYLLDVIKSANDKVVANKPFCRVF